MLQIETLQILLQISPFFLQFQNRIMFVTNCFKSFMFQNAAKLKNDADFKSAQIEKRRKLINVLLDLFLLFPNIVFFYVLVFSWLFA